MNDPMAIPADHGEIRDGGFGIRQKFFQRSSMMRLDH